MAVVARPVARIFAEMATLGRRFFLGDAVREVGGGGGSSGSCNISHRPHFRIRRLHARRPRDLRRIRRLHARRHRGVGEPQKLVVVR